MKGDLVLEFNWQVNHKNTKKKEKNGEFFFHGKRGILSPSTCVTGRSLINRVYVLQVGA
jgi:hypothetical protein